MGRDVQNARLFQINGRHTEFACWCFERYNVSPVADRPGRTEAETQQPGLATTGSSDGFFSVPLVLRQKLTVYRVLDCAALPSDCRRRERPRLVHGKSSHGATKTRSCRLALPAMC